MIANINAFKSIVPLILFLSFGCKSNSQETTQIAVNSTEVVWSADFDKALAEAKAQNKLLFVECYSPTCPHCQALEPFFKKPEVARQYNKDFINYKLDVGVAEQVKHINSRNIWLPSFPMFLFFDSDGKLVHQSAPEPSVPYLTAIAQTALDPKKRAETYPSRFDAGESSLTFLSDLATYGKVIRDTLLTQKAANKLFEIYPKEKLGTEESWTLTKKAVNDIDNGFAKYWFGHVPQANTLESKEGHTKDASNVFGSMIQSSLYGRMGKTYSSAKLQEVKALMHKIGVGQYANNSTWELETIALLRENKPAAALAIGQRTVNDFKGNGAAIVYITHVFNENFKSKEYIPSAKKWMAQALPATANQSYKAEYYYELAKLQKKAGEIAEAKKNAAEALKFSTQASDKVDNKFQQLLSELK